MSCNRARRLVRASGCHGWPDNGGTLLPSYGHKHANKSLPHGNHWTDQLWHMDGFLLASFGFLGELLALWVWKSETRSTSRHKDIREKHYNKANSHLWLCLTPTLFILSSRSLKTEWTHSLTHTTPKNSIKKTEKRHLPINSETKRLTKTHLLLLELTCRITLE